jgi:hypothetical protein
MGIKDPVKRHEEYIRNKALYQENSAFYKDANPDLIRKQGRDYVRKLKLDIVAGYGGKCECCGEIHWEFLTLDHIYGGGAKHRKVERARDLYIRLRREGFPREEFRLLCVSCNFSLGMYGYCPHKIKPVLVVKDGRVRLNELVA